MIAENKHGRTFGPFGTSTGFFMIIGGLISIYFTSFGVLIALFGAFAAFTSASTLIDTDNRKIRFSDNLFGFIRIGKWIDISPGMKLGLKKSHRGYVGYVRGTQPVDIHYNEIQIMLYDSRNKPVIPVKKLKTLEHANNELEKLSASLGLQII